MKKIYYLMTALAVAFGMSACNDPVEPEQPDPEPEVIAPTADFDFTVDGLKVSFTNKSQNATSYKWEFGDDETAKDQNPTHEYAAGGEYTVVLTAANAAGQTAKKEAKLKVAGKPSAYFSSEAVEGRAGAFGKIIKFDASSSANATSIAWDFGDGETSTEFVVEHKFPEYATYKVKATVKNETGDESTYEAEVETVAQNELLKGGSMEEEDAQHWIFISSDNPTWFGEDQFPGEKSWSAKFGYTDDKPAKAQGGVFRANASKQLTQAAFNFTLYQAVELEEGDVVKLGLDMKWAANSLNDGLFWIGVCNNEEAVKTEAQDAAGVEEDHRVEMFNYWAAAGTADWGDGGASVPAYDGNLEGTDEWAAANAELGMGYSGAESTEFTIEKSGTYYFYINYRNVWGNYWGVDVLLDNASLKIISTK